MHFVTLSHRCRLPKKNLMSLSKSLLLSLTVGLAVACNFNPKKAETSTLHIVFQEEEEQFTQLEKERIYTCTACEHMQRTLHVYVGILL